VKKRLLRPAEVETEYGLPTGELAKKRVAGGDDAPPFLRFGRSIYYDREDLERWIMSSKRNSTSDPGTSQAKTLGGFNDRRIFGRRGKHAETLRHHRT
jgi:hypothetical protein